MLTIHKPILDELWFKEMMLSDFDTMSYNHNYGGIIPFPKERWNDWYNKWILNNDNKRYYRYIKDNDTFVGEISYHYDENINEYVCDVLIYAKYRNKGYGKEGLDLICKIARENGINTLYDEIAIDNPSINLFLKNGFIEVNQNEEVVIVKKEL